jgi:hypothetical protein
MRHYKKFYGLDIAHELQKSLQRLNLQDLELSPNVNGYMILAKFKHENEPYSFDLINKQSYLTNGKSVTGYHQVR